MNTIPLLNGAESARMRGNFVLLRADSLRLLLPQQDMSSTEYIDSTPLATTEECIFSYAESGGTPRKVMALSAQMQPLATFPGDRFLLTQLADEQHTLSFAWNEMRVLIDAELEQHALPAVMQGSGALIDSYIELDGELVFCMSAQRLVSQAVSSQG
jgi:hypothetical protein